MAKLAKRSGANMLESHNIKINRRELKEMNSTEIIWGRRGEGEREGSQERGNQKVGKGARTGRKRGDPGEGATERQERGILRRAMPERSDSLQFLSSEASAQSII